MSTRGRVGTHGVGRRLSLGRGGAWLVIIGCALFYLLPLLAMARFSFQRIPVASLGWDDVLDRWTLDGLRTAFADDGFWSALWLSVQLAAGAIALNLGLLLPTAIWAQLRTPHLKPLLDGITLLPWIVPPIALVVGVAGTYRSAAPWFLSSPFSLVPFYAMLALPFTYRSLDAGLRAIDLRTLTEASRSLGAGWWTTLRAVVMPNLMAAIVGSSFLTATVVLGEFTIAALLLKPTFPTYLAEYQRREPQGGMALALLSMLATAVLLMFIALVLRRRGASIDAGPVA
jgi:putative spermidine/putrescine transport system permease protein